jgi:hypothetical protein
VAGGEKLCPYGDGRHKRRPWHEKATGRSGLACVRCSKTWEWHYGLGAEVLLPTYPEGR